jgi:excisionase family DNA binding protein
MEDPLQSKLTPNARDFIGPADAAAYLNVSEKTLRRYISSGRLTGYRVGPKLIRIDRAELDALLSPIPAGGDAA